MSAMSMNVRAGLAAIAVMGGALQFTAPTSAQTSAQTTASEPYGFRGLVLGTPLSDLRRLRFPEAPNARTICTHDPEGSQLRPTVDFEAKPEEIKIGVISCGFFRFERRFGNSTSSLPPEWIPAKLSAAGLEVSPIFWYVPAYVGDATGTGKAPAPRLYRISMRSNAAFWEATKDAFTRRYGEPTRIETIPYIGYRGAKLDNERAIWTNLESSITLTKRSDAPNRLQIVYEHATLTPAGARLGAIVPPARLPPLPSIGPGLLSPSPQKRG